MTQPFDNLEAFWLEICNQNITLKSSGDSQRLKDALLRNSKVIESEAGKPPAFHVWPFKRESGIGIVFRFGASFEILQGIKGRSFRKKELLNAILKYHRSVSLSVTQEIHKLSPKAFNQIFQPKSFNYTQITRQIIDEIADYFVHEINKLSRRRSSDSPLTRRDFLTKKYDDERAISDFKTWLTDPDFRDCPPDYGALLSDQTSDQEAIFYGAKDDDSNRKHHLSLLDEWIKTDSPETMFYPIMAEGQWGMQKALATHLYNESRKGRDGWPRLIAIPLSGVGYGHKHYNYSQIIGILDDFAHRRELSKRPQTMLTDETLEAKINQIRRRLAIDPAIIVFFAHGERRVKQFEIIREIRNDHAVNSLIPSLLLPPTYELDEAATDHREYDLSDWKRNRVVLISHEATAEGSKVRPDGGELEFDRYRSLRPFIRGNNFFKLEEPNRKFHKAVLKQRGYKNFDLIIELKRRCPQLKHVISDNVFRLVDTILSLQISLIDINTEHFDKLKFEICDKIITRLQDVEEVKDGYYPETLEHLVDYFLAMVEEMNPLWGLALKIIALTPGGIQPVILLRVLERFRDNIEKGKEKRVLNAFPKDNFAKSRIKIGQIISEMLDQIPLILGSGQIDDYKSSLVDIHVLYASFLDDLDSRYFGPKLALTYSIVLPEIRDKIIQRLYEGTKKGVLPQYIHLLLCDESFRQHTSGLRRISRPNTGRIRPYRRLIQTIYHGLQGIRLHEKKGKFKLVRPIVKPDHDLLISRAPEKLWLDIYSSYFKDLLETSGGEDNRISRYFGRNGLKLEIVLSLMRPWQLKWALNKKSSSKSPRSKTIFDFLPQEGKIKYQSARLNLETEIAQSTMTLHMDHDIVTTIPDKPYIACEKPITEAEKLYRVKHKYQIQNMIYTGVYSEAMQESSDFIERVIGEIRRKKMRLFVDAQSPKINNLIGSENFNASNKELVGLKSEHLNELLHGLSADNCRSLIDGLNLRAEALVTDADIRRIKLLANHKEVDVFLKEGFDLIYEEMSKALLLYLMAEEIRLYLFYNNHVGNKHMLSGHATRSAIRLALLLERNAVELSSVPVSSPGKFGRYARKMTGELVRLTSNNRRERASVLLLDAQTFRLSGMYGDARNHLKMALESLKRADGLVMSSSIISRNQMRFLLERSKIYRILGRYADSVKQKNIYKVLCEQDLDLLTLIAKQNKLKVWDELIALHKLKFENLT